MYNNMSPIREATQNVQNFISGSPYPDLFSTFDHHSCSARAKRTLFLLKSAHTLTHFIMRTQVIFSSD